MKSVSVDFLARLYEPVQSFCYVCTVTRKDGEVVRLNDSVQDVVISGNTFLGAPGFSVTSVTSASYGQPASADIDFPITSTGPITPAELEAGYFDDAAVVIEMADYQFPAYGTLKVFRGKISQIEKTDQNRATVRLQGFSADLLELIVESYGPDCRAPYLGHSRCGFNVASLTRTATVASVIDARNFTITVTEPLAVDGWFANGAVQFTSGANNGLAFDIRAWTDATNRVSLWFAPYGTVQVGDTMDIAPGCDFSASMCQSKFSNILNFQGFPFLPTASQLQCGAARSIDAANEERPPVGSITVVDC
jgi:uncharacterized phage protein (TIGR02218 family)